MPARLEPSTIKDGYEKAYRDSGNVRGTWRLRYVNRREAPALAKFGA